MNGLCVSVRRTSELRILDKSPEPVDYLARCDALQRAAGSASEQNGQMACVSKGSTILPEISDMPNVTGTMRRFSAAVRKRRRTLRRPTISVCPRYSTEEKQRLADETPQGIDEIMCAAPPGRGARRALYAWACILVLADALSGCALYDTYEKCGFRGCPGDAKITADIVLRLNRCSFIEPNVISVQTMDHVVYLNGVVVSSLEISAAESIADQVPGVARVVNSIVAFTR